MRELFVIRESTENRITYYHLLVFVASLPFNRLYSELALISLMLHTLIHVRTSHLKRFSLREWIVPASLYLLTLFGTIYAPYRTEAFSLWERQAALLLFPLIVCFNSFPFHKYILNVLLVMAISCAITITSLYILAIQTIFTAGLPVSALFGDAFLNHRFAAPIDMHATYFSLYVALGATAVICLLTRQTGRWSRLAYAVLLVVLLAGLIQLSSRAVLIAFAVIVNIVVPVFFLSRSKRIPYAVASVLATLMFVFVLTHIDTIRTRFTTNLRQDLTQADAANDLLEPRAARWRSARALMAQSPIFGHGAGSEIPLLREVYYQHRLYNSYLHSLNIHNQYLSAIIQTGIIGLLVLLFILYAGYHRAIKRRDGLFISFLILVTIVCFSENVLDGNKGIFFFAAFYSLLGKRLVIDN